MECHKRCQNKTRCNKKTNFCQPKTFTCLPKTKINTLTKQCDPIPTPMKRCYAGTKRNKKTGDCENEFIKLCKKHIMVSNLDSVIHTSWLTNKDCNIFMIGERHEPHTQCDSIFQMFKDMMKENLALSKPIQLDLMIEFLQENIANLKPNALSDDDAQLNFVRVYFQNCIKHHKCPIRVHWTDPSEISHVRNIPNWLNELARTDWKDDSWTKNKKITAFFNKESDISRLLTENRFVVKEIEKASKINPKFTLAFATKMFMDMYDYNVKAYKCNWKKLVRIQSRRVMDFYTAARIIKSKMKHVIFYAGSLHTHSVTSILLELNFNLNRDLPGTCF